MAVGTWSSSHYIPNREGNTPIYLAARWHCSEVLECLLQHATIELVNDIQCYNEKTPLMAAAMSGDSACVRLLLENGAHANIRRRDVWMAAQH